MPYWGAYSASKAGLESLVKVYAAEMASTNIKANILDPGVVRTAMRRKAFPGEDAMKNPPPEDITEQFIELALPESTASGEIFTV
jgi:NAD(P)-dependent dehydrogenase (short-subunit alcohol dehydrogenase family)